MNLMRLWTWHKPNFSLLDGRVDHEQSEYVETVQGVREAYRELTNRLGTDQLIWCYTVPGQRRVLPYHTEVEWILEVPAKAILAFVDDMVWNRILGITGFALPRELELQWKKESISQHPHDSSARKTFVESRRNAFWNQSPPSGNWWNHLFVNERSHECVTALIPHPVEREWVVNHPTNWSKKRR